MHTNKDQMFDIELGQCSSSFIYTHILALISKIKYCTLIICIIKIPTHRIFIRQFESLRLKKKKLQSESVQIKNKTKVNKKTMKSFLCYTYTEAITADDDNIK